MDIDKLDKIHIKDLMLRCIIGLNYWEREKKQDVMINITLYADLSTACQSDNIEDTVDYKDIKQKVVDMAEASSYMLVEPSGSAYSGYMPGEPKSAKSKSDD